MEESKDSITVKPELFLLKMRLWNRKYILQMYFLADSRV